MVPGLWARPGAWSCREDELRILMSCEQGDRVTLGYAGVAVPAGSTPSSPPAPQILSHTES